MKKLWAVTVFLILGVTFTVNAKINSGSNSELNPNEVPYYKYEGFNYNGYKTVVTNAVEKEVKANSQGVLSIEFIKVGLVLLPQQIDDGKVVNKCLVRGKIRTISGSNGVEFFNFRCVLKFEKDLNKWNVETLEFKKLNQV